VLEETTCRVKVSLCITHTHTHARTHCIQRNKHTQQAHRIITSLNNRMDFLMLITSIRYPSTSHFFCLIFYSSLVSASEAAVESFKTSTTALALDRLRMVFTTRTHHRNTPRRDTHHRVTHHRVTHHRVTHHTGTHTPPGHYTGTHHILSITIVSPLP